MAIVYILKSPRIGKFYIGSCLNLEERLEEHRNGAVHCGPFRGDRIIQRVFNAKRSLRGTALNCSHFARMLRPYVTRIQTLMIDEFYAAPSSQTLQVLPYSLQKNLLQR